MVVGVMVDRRRSLRCIWKEMRNVRESSAQRHAVATRSVRRNFARETRDGVHHDVDVVSISNA